MQNTPEPNTEQKIPEQPPFRRHGHDCCPPNPKHRFIYKLTHFIPATILFIVLSIVAWAYFAQPWRQTITVTGTATSTIKNQIASYNANINAQDQSKTKAVSTVNEKAEKLISEVKKFGIPEADIKTNNVSVYQMQEPFIEDGVQKYKPGRWSASIGVEIKLRDIDRSTEFATLLTSMEITDVFGPNLGLDNANLDDSAILAAALENARHKAQAIVAVSGRKLGKVVSISEGYSSTPQPFYKTDYAGIGGGGGGTPIEVGSTETTRTVSVTFLLK